MSSALGLIFDEDPERYDRARPGYPVDLLQDLASLGGIGRGTRILEIGPGTGQATEALVSAGAQVVGVEPGAGLGRLLARKFDTAVEVVTSRFEAWPLPEQPFDLVTAFTSWHWLDQSVRGPKAAAALRPGGLLATITTFHILGGTAGFFADAQACYEKWDPATEPGIQLEPADAIPVGMDEIDTSELFQPAIRRRYQQEITYSTAEYLDVLNTYSGHRALSAERREGLLGCLADLADHKYGGTIRKRYLYELRVAERVR